MGAREERLRANEALIREVNERVAEVARHSNYLVVEKEDPDAEDVARETDPQT